MIPIQEEYYKGKEYLFRGESNNKWQSNYSKKHKNRFASRFYAFEIYHGIYGFGNVAIYELLNRNKLWEYEESVEDFITEFELEDYEVPELNKIYKISKLSDCTEYGGTITLDYHDLYHSRQLVAIAYLEDNYKSQYDGIVWYEWSDTPEYQVMIWNESILKRLTYQEAKELVKALEKEYPDSIYAKDKDWNDYWFTLAKTKKENK